jgi:hypothetical protein
LPPEALEMKSSISCKNDHIIFNVGTPSLEARNIRIVNIITNIIEESKLISLCMVLVKSELSKEKVNGISFPSHIKSYGAGVSKFFL